MEVRATILFMAAMAMIPIFSAVALVRIGYMKVISTQGNLDTILLKFRCSPADVSLKANSNGDLILSINGTSDTFDCWKLFLKFLISDRADSG